jgi:hypothetical protein
MHNAPRHPLVEAFLQTAMLKLLISSYQRRPHGDWEAIGKEDTKPTPIAEAPGYFKDFDGNIRISHRAYERNRYAPWGRGALA